MARSEERVVEQDGAASLRDSVDDNNNSDDSNSSSGSSDDGSKSQAIEASGGKYQLRPRSLHARRLCDGGDWSFQDAIRSKPRPPPLSRYRRKTANARERYRMRQINTAFESLRGVLPSWVCSRRAASDMTKIATLRLASAYIRSLQDILDGSAPQDTCSWVLSAILDGPTPKRQELQPKSQKCAALCSPEPPDVMALLCGSADHQALQDDLDAESYFSAISESDAVTFFLKSDSTGLWGAGDGQQAQVAS
ncbi:helix-loop-helix protein delilah-like [Penaeus monodon]|uniref:helix-loop-helix protein delilah-like n=1 Tax=Penaeus monodon TaxID=6687 RepID=UPI0018A6E59A|nr:helix-loop-helix protein delilah-like [Penaeus monodon]